MNDKPTKVRLADALVEAGLTVLAARALGGAYDDFESDSAFPLTDLVNDIRDAGGPEALVLRVQNGDFDASDAEADAWFQKEGRYLLREKPEGGGVVTSWRTGDEFDMRGSVKAVRELLDRIERGDDPLPTALIFALASPCIHGEGGDDVAWVFDAAEKADLDTLLTQVERGIDGEGPLS